MLELTLLLLLLAEDLEQKPSSRVNIQSVFPYALCDHLVTKKCECVWNDDCGIWFDISCIELFTHDYELLHKSNTR